MGRRGIRAALMRAFRLFLALLLGVLVVPAARAQGVPVTAEVVDLALPTGGSGQVLFLGRRSGQATVILLAGGDGVFTIDAAGNVTPDRNFLVRTRGLWVAQGFDVVLPGPPNGQSLSGRRSGADYAGELDRVVDFARSRSNAPIWLIGTSQGAIAAVNGGARLGSKVAGVVLTSSITRPGRAGETIFDAGPGLISTPVLVVANSADTCASTPPGDAPAILAALVRSPRKELMLFESHEIRSDPCRARSPHGYLGIEPVVVQRIAEWIRSVPVR
jgi:pimeloyl-ACP methyl ester carboxylesterase